MTHQNTPFHVRRAGPPDIQGLIDCRVNLFRELGEGPDAPSLPAFEAACREALLKLFAAGACLAWIAEAPTGILAGSLIMLLHHRLPSPRITPALEGYILNVYVVPERRRRGIALALSMAALASARELGLARLRLHATSAGRAAYVRVGFTAREDEMELVLDSSPAR